MIEPVPNFFIDHIIGLAQKEAEFHNAAEGELDKKLSWAKIQMLSNLIQFAQATVDINKRTDN